MENYTNSYANTTVMRYYMKHITLFLTLLAICNKGNSQTSVRLILKNGKQISKVYAQDFSFKESLTSPYLDTINFNFEKSNSIDLFNIGCYINDKQPWKQIWLDSGKITILAHMDSISFKIDTVINSPMYDYVKKFNIEFGNITKQKDTSKANLYLIKNLKLNIDNPFSLWISLLYINLNQNLENNILELKQLLSKQGLKFSWFRLYDDVNGRIDNILSTKSLTISDFKFIDKQKKVTLLSLNKANFYVLDFWFLGCLPCRKEHKIIQRKYNELLRNKVDIIGISTDSYSKNWKNYLTTNHYEWPNYLQASDKKITKALSINAFPFYILINNQGEIVGRYNSFTDILKRFEIDE